MTLSYYDEQGRAPQSKTLLRALILFDLGFVATIVLGWTVLSYWLVGPIAWATWAPLTAGIRPGFFEYPFVLVWSGPLIGIGLGWMAEKGGSVKLARGIVLAPVLFILITFSWYYLTPVEWH